MCFLPCPKLCSRCMMPLHVLSMELCVVPTCFVFACFSLCAALEVPEETRGRSALACCSAGVTMLKQCSRPKLWTHKDGHTTCIGTRAMVCTGCPALPSCQCPGPRVAWHVVASAYTHSRSPLLIPSHMLPHSCKKKKRKTRPKARNHAAAGQARLHVCRGAHRSEGIAGQQGRQSL